MEQQQPKKTIEEIAQMLADSKSLNQAYNLGAMLSHLFGTCEVREAVAGMALATCFYDLLGRCDFPEGPNGKPIPKHTRPHEMELSRALSAYMAKESMFLAQYDAGAFTDPRPIVPGPVQ